MGKYYVYRHIRLDTLQPFYIGLGTKKVKYFKTSRDVIADNCNHIDSNKLYKNILKLIGNEHNDNKRRGRSSLPTRREKIFDGFSFVWDKH